MKDLRKTLIIMRQDFINGRIKNHWFDHAINTMVGGVLLVAIACFMILFGESKDM